ncbi:hypothetical protein KY308_00795 [Candidatus Woesearchaeota archaeon]|nr:hypothetical protein [Candidatus Woesearchaeota archaeon]
MNLKVILTIAVLVLLAGCASQTVTYADRESKIPSDAVKITPEMDVAPPKLNSEDYENPVPLPYPVNTAGAEDSPFITPDGNTLYFFFTPDVRVPVEKQLIDGVTGIYVSKKVNGEWQKPERVILQDKGKLSLDGCEFVQGNKMLFCTAREGYTGIHWFSAEFKDGKWQNWKNADFNPDFDVGELHISPDGNELYYHSDREGGKGGLDIWMLKKVNGEWSSPENVAAVNTAGNEGWPALSPDGTELWLTKDYGIWRSKNIDGKWSSPELIVSNLAGEASIDNNGNVYFVHHYYKDDTMLEADIYVAYKK